MGKCIDKARCDFKKRLNAFKDIFDFGYIPISVDDFAWIDFKPVCFTFDIDEDFPFYCNMFTR